MGDRPHNLVLYFGCWGEPGHYLRWTNRLSVRDFDCDRFAIPRPSDLDASCLFLPRPEVPGHGALTYLPAPDLTILAWWDRTFDQRGKCNAAIIVDGKLTADQCWSRFAAAYVNLAPKLKMPIICVKGGPIMVARP